MSGFRTTVVVPDRLCWRDHAWSVPRVRGGSFDRPRERARVLGQPVLRDVAAMERAKLGSRAADPDDARGKRVRLTAKARGLRLVLVPVVKKMVAKMEHGVSEKDLELTRQTLQRLTENLG